MLRTALAIGFLSVLLATTVQAQPVAGEYCDSQGQWIKFTDAGKWRTSRGAGGNWSSEDGGILVLELLTGQVLEANFLGDKIILNDPSPANGQINRKEFIRGSCSVIRREPPSNPSSAEKRELIEVRIARKIAEDFNCPAPQLVEDLRLGLHNYRRGIPGGSVIEVKGPWQRRLHTSKDDATVYKISLHMKCLSPHESRVFYVWEYRDSRITIFDHDVDGDFSE